MHEKNTYQLFRLPFLPLTSVIEVGDKAHGNWNMSSGEHLRMMWVPGQAPRDQEDDDQEAEEEEYEQGGDKEEEEPNERASRAGFHLRALEFTMMQEWHMEQLQAMDNYYL